MATKRKLLDHGLCLLTGVSLMILKCSIAHAQEGQPARADTTGRLPYNILFVINDQHAYRLLAGPDYSLPALDTIARHGVAFRNHYIAAAMCSPSRASFLTGQPPQVHHVFDQMEYPYTPSLNPDLPNMGSVLKGLGYRTAYFGKFEMDQTLLDVKPTVNYGTAIQRYGFDVFSAGGDTSSDPQSGFGNDPFIAGEVVRYLHQSASEARQSGRPFFWSRAWSILTTSCTGMATSPANLPSRRPSHRRRCQLELREEVVVHAAAEPRRIAHRPRHGERAVGIQERLGQLDGQHSY
jgi:Sulfatase